MAYTAKLLLVPFGFCTLFAQQSTPSTIQVTGRATVSAAPDQALMTVGVTTSAESAQEAASKNAALADALIMRIRNSFGQKVDVETASYSVMQEPEPRPQQQAATVPRGFRVTNLVRVLVKDIDDLAQVIDAALSSGANQLQGLTFQVKDSEPLERRALQEAARDARTKANALAQALGLRVVSIRTVSEGGLPPRPFERSVVAAASEGFAPPIEAGTLETTASVTLEVTVQ